MKWVLTSSSEEKAPKLAASNLEDEYIETGERIIYYLKIL